MFGKVIFLVVAIVLAGATMAAEVADVDRLNELVTAGNLDQAVEILDRVHPPTGERSTDQASASQLRLDMVRARILAARGETSKAIALRESLDAPLARMFGDASVEMLENRRALGARLFYAGQRERAFALFRQSAAAARTHLGPDAETTLLIETTLAQFLSQVERTGPAVALLRSIVERAKSASVSPVLLDDARFALAQTLRNAHREDEALAHAQAVHDFRMARFGPSHRKSIDATVELSIAYLATGRADLAEALAHDAYQRAVAANGTDNPQALRAGLQEARLLTRARRYSDAVARYTSLVPAAVRVLGEGDVFTFDAAWESIRAGYFDGNAAPCRHASLVERYAGAAGVVYADLKLVARTVAAQCRDLAGDTKGAEALFAQAVEARADKAGSVDTDQLLRLRMLADTRLRLKQDKRARAALKRYVAGAETIRRSAVLAFRTDFGDWIESGEHLPGYRTLVQLDAEADDAAAALATAELTKARLLGDSERGAQLERHASPGVRSRIDAARARIAKADLEIALATEAAGQVAATAARDAAEREMAKLRAELTAGIDALASPSPRTSARALRRDEVFVSYVVDGANIVGIVRAGPHSTAQAFVSVTADPRLLVDAARRAWGQSVQIGRLWSLPGGGIVQSLAKPHAKAVVVSDGEAIERLSRALLEPLGPLLAAGTRIIVSPDGPLALLPFEALPWRGRPLGARFDVTYAHSLTTLAQTRERAKRYREISRQPLLLIAVEQPVLHSDKVDTRFRDLVWPSLPGARREADAIAHIVPGAGSTVLRDADAGVDRVKALASSGALARYRIIHVAAHAWYSDRSPDLSSLVLGDAGGSAPTSGYLTAAELRSFDLASDLVVLSACTSSGGAVSAGEGLVGLVHSLFVAGTAGAVVSMWPVEDRWTAELMTDFYTRLAGGANAGAALSQAKRALASRGVPVSAWAAFVYYGAG